MKKHLIFLVTVLCLASMTMQAQQRLVMFEQFTSSTCAPYCRQLNELLNPWLAANAEKVVVVRYQMNWPGAGDPYYTAEGGVRRTYYNVSGVPAAFTNGVENGGSSIQAMFNNIVNAINTGYTQPAQATITGAFSVSGTTISIQGSVTPLISGSGYKVYVVVNEKKTYGNHGSNGETEFHHVMMKMFPNGSGQEVTLTAGTAIPFSYTYDMATTHVEEMDDLEVAVFVQNVSTKAILNAAYLDDDNTPTPENVTATQVGIDNLNVNFTWTTPAGVTPDGFNVYRDGVKLNTSLVTGNSYQDVAPEYAKTYTYAVAMVVGGTEGFKKQATVLINVTMPEPIITATQQLRGKKMLIEWDAQSQYPVKYYVYRNNMLQNSVNPTTGNTFEYTAPDYNKEYCFQIEPVFNEITGAKSSKACVTLLEVGMPTNLKAQQVSGAEKAVLLTWGAPFNAVGYNIYRDNIQINTEPVTSLEYTDIAPEYNVQYTYLVHGVATTGGEGESGATVNITLMPTGIYETDKDLFAIYPNPVSGTLNIRTEETITDCQIFNLQGQLIYATKSGTKEITTDNWVSGIYIIRIATEKGTVEKQFVKN